MASPATDRMKHEASQFATEAKNKAQDAGSAIADTAKDAANKARDAAAYVGDKAADATAAVGSGMKSLAGTIRERGPHGGMMGKATAAVADTLNSGGQYLEQEGLSGIGEDLTNLIRRNPIPALLIGFGLGFLLARATRS